MRAINSALKNNKIMTVKRFQNGDTLIIFNEKTKIYKTDDI
jgi:hypothetical protein